MDRRQEGWIVIESATRERRIYWIDILRGLAILLMIPANMAPYMGGDHPMAYRFVSSFAAPIFIMLSAGMVVLRAEKHTFGYYLKRASIVVLFGVLLDILLWGILPFTSFDVLYTIGVGMVVVYLLRKIDARELIVISIIIFLASYVLLQMFGYHREALEVYYMDEVALPAIGRLLQSWFIDGWFPLFPWLGFALLGAAFFKYVQFKESKVPANMFFWYGLLLLGIGLLLLFVPIPNYENFASGEIIDNRGGYSEIFYPATPGYILAAIGIFLLLVRIVFHSKPNPLGDFISFFGNYAMLAYVAHQILGVVLIEPVLNALGLDHIYIGWFFTFANMIVIALVYFICLIASHVKQNHPVKGVFMHVLIGK